MRYFKIPDLQEKYIPHVINLMKNGYANVRKVACKNLISFLQINHYTKKRTELISIINDNFFKSNSFSNRMIYLEICLLSPEKFSRNFFRLHFIPECFDLSFDKIANVRRKLAEILPLIRNYLFIDDDENIDKLHSSLKKLIKDKDLDVSMVKLLIIFILLLQNLNYN